jgi:hypothetical protein
MTEWGLIVHGLQLLLILDYEPVKDGNQPN